MAYPPFLQARSFKFVDRRTGSIAALTSTTWANLDATADIQLEANVGDTIIVSANGLWGGEAQNAALDVATWNGSALVNWFGSGEPTTTTGDGIPGWFSASSITYESLSGLMARSLVAGDIANGQVTLRLRYRVTASKTLMNSSTDPFQWMAWNIGPTDQT